MEDLSADEPSQRGVGERIWYQPESERVRPAWRLVVPLVVGLSIYSGIETVVWAAVGFEVQSPVDTGTSILLLVGNLVAPSGAAVATLVVASRLHSKPLSVDRLAPSKAWLRDFGGGMGIGIVAAGCMIAVAVVAGEISMTVGTTGVGADSPVVGVGVLALLLGALVTQVAFQEFIYRKLTIKTVSEALRSRSVEIVPAVGAAVVVSVLLYGLPGPLVRLSGVSRLEVVVSTAVLGLLFAAGYVLTGALALPIGVNLGGGITLGSLYQNSTIGTFSYPSLVSVDATLADLSLGWSLRLQSIRVLIGILLIAAWVRVCYGDIRVDERVYTRSDSEA